MLTQEQVENSSNGDTAIGREAHYPVVASLINENNFKTGIELGVAYGGNSAHILANTKIEKLVGIDSYKWFPNHGMPQPQNQDDYDAMYQFAKNRLNDSRYRLIRENTLDAYNILIKEGVKYDFIFIDANHTYDAVTKEIELYSKLIKEGGMISGHDYGQFEGVTKAVDDYAKNNGFKVKALAGHVFVLEVK